MSYSVTQEEIFSVGADAAVLGVENPVVPAYGPVFRQLAEAGGDSLRKEMRKLRFLSVGRAAAVNSCGLPFQHLTSKRGNPDCFLGSGKAGYSYRVSR